MSTVKKATNLLQEFSLPLIGGVIIAMIAANVAPEWYAHTLHWQPFGDAVIFGHKVTLHFLVNDIFMVFFFGIAAKEITEACLPGGDLNPPTKALNPLMGTLGGVIGPVGVFFGGLALLYATGIYGAEESAAGVSRGWGIPTATDIALAWLVARTVFGPGHPAIKYLLLLAVADDAIGLVIIAVFYGDPAHPAQPVFLLLVVLGMAVAFGMRRFGVKSWPAYVGIAGPIAWSGLVLAHLHPALALVFIVPFLPGDDHDHGLFSDDEANEEEDHPGADDHGHHASHSPLHEFEHQLKLFVDLGLFFYAFANAGVAMSGMGAMTWLILASLVVGKTIGIPLFSLLGVALGFPLPNGMDRRDLVMAALVAALGLTVALFVAGAAFTSGPLQGEAKMGALFSGLVGFVAIALARALGMGKPKNKTDTPDSSVDEAA